MDYYLLNTTQLGTSIFPAGSLIVGAADPVAELQAAGGILVPAATASMTLLQAVARAQQARARGAAYQTMDNLVQSAFLFDQAGGLPPGFALTSYPLSVSVADFAGHSVPALDIPFVADPLPSPSYLLGFAGYLDELFSDGGAATTTISFLGSFPAPPYTAPFVVLPVDSSTTAPNRFGSEIAGVDLGGTTPFLQVDSSVNVDTLTSGALRATLLCASF